MDEGRVEVVVKGPFPTDPQGPLGQGLGPVPVAVLDRHQRPLGQGGGGGGQGSGVVASSTARASTGSARSTSPSSRSAIPSRSRAVPRQVLAGASPSSAILASAPIRSTPSRQSSARVMASQLSTVLPSGTVPVAVSRSAAAAQRSAPAGLPSNAWIQVPRTATAG
jgi:hypothetical protein